MTTRPDLSRRALLERLGVAAAMVPLLGARRARAATAYPRRLVIVLQTGGVIPSAFWPTGTDLATATFPETLAPLRPHARDLVLVDGIAMQNFLDSPGRGAGHENYSCCFTGAPGVDTGSIPGTKLRIIYGGGPTPDQVVADEIAKSVKLPLRSLALAVQVDLHQTKDYQRRAFFRGPTTAVTPEGDPFRVMDQVFASPLASPAELERHRFERKSVLDFAGRDLESFAARLGRADRERVLGHLQAVRELEGRLSTSPPAGQRCASPKAPVALTRANIADNARYPDLLAFHADLLVTALACDVTRVATLQLHDRSADKIVHDWLGVGGVNQEYGAAAGGRGYHDVQHRPGPGNKDKIKVDAWYLERMAALLAKMKSVPEPEPGNPDATLLDHSVVLWANHMGDGGIHTSDRLPWILAGSAGGYFRTGRLLRPGRVPTNAILTALCNAMGVPRATFGDPRYGGELAGLRG